MEWETGRRIGAGGAVLRSFYCTAVTKRELSWKAKLSIYQSVFVPSFTYGHEGWFMTERTRLQIEAAEMGILRRVGGVSLKRSSDKDSQWSNLKLSTACSEPNCNVLKLVSSHQCHQRRLCLSFARTLHILSFTTDFSGFLYHDQCFICIMEVPLTQTGCCSSRSGREKKVI